ncbi:MAG: PDZ domain-containing protein [Pseudomonadota bacterium]|nr:PDZ domain-containing protein [Pseudomonadota bacterium]
MKARMLNAGLIAVTLMAPAYAGTPVAPAAPVAPKAAEAPAAPPALSAVVKAEMDRARAEMKRAQAEMKRAAEEMARISREQKLSNPKAFAYEFATDPDRAMLGVTITDGAEVDGRSGGVLVTGVTPGSGADKAGIKTGDLLLVANGVGLSAVDQTTPSKRLWSVMEPLKPGDPVTLDYRRDGKRATTKVIASRPAEAIAPEAMMDWHEDRDINVLIPPVPPVPPQHWSWSEPGIGNSLQLARIDDDLAGYFRTKDGVLVLRAPEGGTLALKSGDVIQRINGRSVASPVAAWEELASADSAAVKMDVIRHGKTLALSGKLAAKADVLERKVIIKHIDK